MLTGAALFLLPYLVGSYLVLSVAMTVLVLMRHRRNLQRLRAGTEPRIGDSITTPIRVRNVS